MSSIFLGDGGLAGVCAPTIATMMGGPAHVQADVDHAEEAETEIVVHATRIGCRVQDGLICVEVIDHEEIEEKLLMRLGNIAMLVSEAHGVRVQATSPRWGWRISVSRSSRAAAQMLRMDEYLNFIE